MSKRCDSGDVKPHASTYLRNYVVVNYCIKSKLNKNWFDFTLLGGTQFQSGFSLL